MDLAAQHAQVADEVALGWADVLARTAFVGGAEVAEFERAFAEFSGVRHCVGVGNGTDALEFSLRALDIRAGDECVLPANTFIATAEAVARAGATPVLVDCDERSYLIDPAAVAAAITPRTRAILPVHLYGQIAEVERLAPLADLAGAVLVEDAAQAQGARRQGAGMGAGRVAATSFYPGKNLGAYGDAGAVVTNDEGIAAQVGLLREHGSPRKYEHATLGFNSRMDTLQAVVLSAKLRRLETWNAARRAAAARYDELLGGNFRLAELQAALLRVKLPHLPRWSARRRAIATRYRERLHRLPLVTPPDDPGCVWNQFVVRVPDRDLVLKRLQAAGIGAGIHYPTPVHLTPAFRSLGYPEGAFPVAERLAGEILSLPLFAEITVEQQERVVSVLAAALQ